MKPLYLLLSLLVLSACKPKVEPIETVIKQELVVIDLSTEDRQVKNIIPDPVSAITIASRYMGFHERRQRGELKLFTGVDPVRIDWCAAFVNSVLHELDIPGSESVSDWPLTARSFLRWGHRVKDPIPGDIIVFPRGRESWQGHVGFYVGTEYKNGRRFYQILGGNQSDAVTIELFPARSAISIRRYRRS
jgi:uncharacterized protein (TIGR02594 family)